MAELLEGHLHSEFLLEHMTSPPSCLWHWSINLSLTRMFTISLLEKTVKVNLQLSAIKSSKLGNWMGNTIFALQLSLKRHILNFGLPSLSHNNPTQGTGPKTTNFFV